MRILLTLFLLAAPARADMIPPEEAEPACDEESSGLRYGLFFGAGFAAVMLADRLVARREARAV